MSIADTKDRKKQDSDKNCASDLKMPETSGSPNWQHQHEHFCKDKGGYDNPKHCCVPNISVIILDLCFPTVLQCSFDSCVAWQPLCHSSGCNYEEKCIYTQKNNASLVYGLHKCSLSESLGTVTIQPRVRQLNKVGLNMTDWSITRSNLIILRKGKIMSVLKSFWFLTRQDKYTCKQCQKRNKYAPQCV